MIEDKSIWRFYILVLLFVISMLIVILSPHFLSILLGWDRLGLISYCLVIYYQNRKSYSAEMTTIMINRIGDVVTAVVYLIIRFHEVLLEDVILNNLLLYARLVTMFLAGWAAIYWTWFQNNYCIINIMSIRFNNVF